MIVDLNVIRTITIKAFAEVDNAVRKLNELGKAHGDVAVVSDQSSKASLSVKNALDRQQNSLDSTYRAQQQFNKSQLDITRGFNEGQISLERYNQLSALNTQRLENATRSHGVFAAALSGVRGQLVALAAGAGPVGVFLAGLGPWGLAAAAGIGLVRTAFETMIGMATQLAEKSSKLNEFATTTGFTTDQVQALTQAAARHDVQMDQAAGAIQRFTVAWEEMRKGGGTMLEEINKINPALARQMQQAKDTAIAWDIFSKAATAAELSQRNLLLRAAGGRGGITALGGIAGDTAAAGGTNNLTRGVVEAGNAIDHELIEKLKNLRADIDATGTRIWDKMAKSGAEAELSGVAVLRHHIEWIIDATNKFSPSQGWKELTEWLGRMTGLGGEPLKITITPPPQAMLANAPLPRARPAEADLQPLTPEAILARERAMMSILGDSAKQTEQLTFKRLELAEATRKAGLSGEYATRAEAQFIFAQKQANEAWKESLGVSSEAEIARARLAALADKEAKTLQLATEQRERAVAVINLEARAAAEAAQIRASSLPGLKALEFEYGNFAKQLDQVGVSMTNSISSGLVDMAMGTKPAAQAFKDMVASISRSILQMIINMQVAIPIARGLQSLLGGFLPAGGGAGAGAAIGGGPGGNVWYGQHAGGVGAAEASFSRYIYPAYHDDVIPKLHSGVGPGEYRAILRDDEGVFTPGQMRAMGGGGGVNIVSNVHNYAGAQGVEQEVTDHGNGTFSIDTIIPALENAMATRAARGHGALAKTMKINPPARG